jgi:hypothetical protein
MKVLTSVIIIVSVAGVLGGCALTRTNGSGSPSSMEDSDRVFCERHDGRWVAGVCEYPTPPHR